MTGSRVPVHPGLAGGPVYLDYNATTPVDPRVAEVMVPHLTLLRLRKEIDAAEPGTVVHVIATDPAAPLDLPAWCHMTGHHYLGPVTDDVNRPVYALRLAADARPTRLDAAWHRAQPSC